MFLPSNSMEVTCFCSLHVSGVHYNVIRIGVLVSKWQGDSGSRFNGLYIHHNGGRESTT